ncbi:Bax inhibitor-1/YccA family protein (plasmid) [Candidatus Trichorickettsia mobilis]|uniref:Bax inhibitor-1/YccA family protein n=1 Tax=Candidatus Trichorickettsia mobilis TaxID=1346319 RepID=UPI002B262710|nr:Bax inhibitor-1/YccA family protein [Candidatus Trichorickettsia mobilis]WPY01729.1 Bax inhibitor-1/YccA family protein [Candidatus Trichorickettsia mobilis]
MKYNNYGFARESSTYYDEGLRIYMLSIYRNMAMALSISALVAYIVGSSEQLAMMLFSTPLAYAVMFAPLIYIFFFSRNLMSMSKEQAMLHLGIFAALNGLSLGSIFLVYTAASIAKTFFITASTFGAMSLYGYSTKKDLTGLGSFAYMGLIGLIIASLINVFLRSAALDFAVSLIGVGIFTALTAYDTQKLKSIYYGMNGSAARAGNIAVYGALTLYLDFINLFTMLLHFVGVRKSDY